jgi:hypothetical protein
MDIDGKEIFIPTVKEKEQLRNSKYRALSGVQRTLLSTNPNKILKDLQKMTNDKLKLSSVKVKDKIVGYIVQIETYCTENEDKNYDKGTVRIRNLIKSDQYSAIAKSADGTNGTVPLGKGNSVIYYDEKNKAKGEGGIVNEDGSKGRPPFIGLGHEMGHAENYISTDLKPKQPMEEGVYFDPDTNSPQVFSTDEKVSREKDNEIREEHLGEKEDGQEVKKRAEIKKR